MRAGSATTAAKMYVVKRDGRKEPVHFDKITARITKLSYGLNPEFCDPVTPRTRLRNEQLSMAAFEPGPGISARGGSPPVPYDAVNAIQAYCPPHRHGRADTSGLVPEQTRMQDGGAKA